MNYADTAEGGRWSWRFVLAALILVAGLAATAYCDDRTSPGEVIRQHMQKANASVPPVSGVWRRTVFRTDRLSAEGGPGRQAPEESQSGCSQQEDCRLHAPVQIPQEGEDHHGQDHKDRQQFDRAADGAVFVPVAQDRPEQARVEQPAPGSFRGSQKAGDGQKQQGGGSMGRC